MNMKKCKHKHTITNSIPMMITPHMIDKSFAMNNCACGNPAMQVLPETRLVVVKQCFDCGKVIVKEYTDISPFV